MEILWIKIGCMADLIDLGQASSALWHWNRFEAEKTEEFSQPEINLFKKTFPDDQGMRKYIFTSDVLFQAKQAQICAKGCEGDNFTQIL